MISFCKIFYVSFIELLVPVYFLYRYFIESDPERFSVKTSTFCSCNAPQSRLFSIKRNDALTAAYGNDNEAIFSVKVDQKRA